MSMKQLSTPMLCALCGKSPTRLSAAMHNAAFKSRNLDYTYVTFNTVDTSFAINAMRELGIRGYSMTIPHKERAVELVDEVDKVVQSIGALNTVINNGQKLFGYNTDIYGIERAFAEAGVEIANKRCLILGAGGAARGAVYVASLAFAREVSVWNRNLVRAQELARSFQNVRVVEQISPHEFDVIVNATPIGSNKLANSEDVIPFDLLRISKEQVIFDMVTNHTKLLNVANNIGAITIKGVRMLLHQAAKQYELFTERKDVPLLEMQEALAREIRI